MDDVYAWIEIIAPIAMAPVVARAHRPYVALAWLATILVAPILGTAACLYFGEFRIRRGRRRHQKALEALGPHAEALRKEMERHRGPRDAEDGGLESMLERIGGEMLGGWPAVGGNEARLFDDSERCIDALMSDIDAAERHVHLLFYLFAPDRTGRRVADAVRRAARRGVRCRMLVGAYSSRFETRGSFFRDLAPGLQEAGVTVEALRPFDPLRAGLARIDLRNHRKIAVIDDHVAWVGSQNVHEPDHGLDEGTWHQLMLRLHGPAAAQVQSVFLQDWCVETDECPPADTGPRDLPRRGDVVAQTLWWGPSQPDSGFVRALLALLGSARDRVHLTSPYFVPDEPIELALQTASARGVDVQVVLPYRSDKRLVDAAARHCFGSLLEAGVKIHRHRRGVLHTKCLSVDDRLAMIGSANFDQRSFHLDNEIATILYDADLARRVREIQERYIADAEPVELAAWLERSRVTATADATLGLLSPLL